MEDLVRGYFPKPPPHHLTTMTQQMASKRELRTRTKKIDYTENGTPATVSKADEITAKKLIDMRASLLTKINQLGQRFPMNTLDQLIEDLGGPTKVAVCK